MKETLFVNLMGGPCTGKSTLCAMIFSDLKIRGIDTEMALEYAKDVVWEENYKKLSNQVYIFGKQHNRIYRLNGKVDVVITDSPLLNSIIYDETDNQELKALVLSEFKKLNTVNFYVDRTFEYIQNGRVQDYDEALEKDRSYKQLLDENGISYMKVQSGNKSLSLIIEEILGKWKDIQ